MPTDKKGIYRDPRIKVILTHEHVYYELTPVSKKHKLALAKKTGGEGSIIYQADYDYPGLAEALGWTGRNQCRTRGIPDFCKEIDRATAWLDRRLDRVFLLDPVYLFGYDD